MIHGRTAAIAAGLLAPAESGAGSRANRDECVDVERAVDEDAGNDDEADLQIGFVGDVMLGRGVDRAHSGGPATAVWGSMLERLRHLDGFVANLECVLSERGEPWPDKRFHFRAGPDWSREALAAVDASAVSLANNHAMDFGSEALRDTIEHLDAIGVGYAGAGPDLDAALEPAVVEVGDATLALFGLVDHWGEFAAGPDEVGTAFVDVDAEPDVARDYAEMALERARDADPDLVVASLHFGRNYDTHPSTAHRRFAHWLVDRGVDVVHGHSAHVVQGVEVYDGAPIVYDAGEFVDDYADRRGYHNDRSYLFELVEPDAGGDRRLRLVPIEIDGYQVHRASEAVATALERTIRERSAPFDTTFEPAAEPGVLRVPLSG